MRAEEQTPAAGSLEPCCQLPGGLGDPPDIPKQPCLEAEGSPTRWQPIDSGGAPAPCRDHALHPLGFSRVVEAQEGRLAQADGATCGERGCQLPGGASSTGTAAWAPLGDTLGRGETGAGEGRPGGSARPCRAPQGGIEPCHQHRLRAGLKSRSLHDWAQHLAQPQLGPGPRRCRASEGAGRAPAPPPAADKTAPVHRCSAQTGSFRREGGGGGGMQGGKPGLHSPREPAAEAAASRRRAQAMDGAQRAPVGKRCQHLPQEGL